MVKKLKWYDDRFRNVYRFKSRVLTLEEANERLHKYLPNMTILKYYGVSRPAEVYCEDCESIFKTLGNIGAYMYGTKTLCENCKEIKRVTLAKRILKEMNLEYLGYHEMLASSGGVCRYIDYKCLECGYTSSIKEKVISHGDIKGCKNCKYLEVINKYKDILEENNCTYISAEKTKDHRIKIMYKYNDCGHKHCLTSVNIVKGMLPKCNKCRGTERELKCMEFYRSIGFVYLKSVGYNSEECFHLFCGHSTKKKYSTLNSYKSKSNLTCKHCRGKLANSKPKEHNKHLVEECYNILEYTLYLKQELERNPKDITEIYDYENYEFICDTLECIEGWINNFKSIREKYSNGDLGTVLENNPYYSYVWNIVVPVLEDLLDINK